MKFLNIYEWHSGKESTCQCRRCKRHGCDPWVGKTPWRRKWQPTPVFLPGKFPGQRNLVSYSPWGCKELDRTEWLTLALFTLKWHTQSKAPGKDFEVSLGPLGAGVKRSEAEQTAVGWSPPCSLHISNAIMPSVCCRTCNSMIALVQLISKRRD